MSIPVTLGDDEVERFRRDGYLVVDALTTADEVAALTEVYDRLFDADTAIAPADRIELAGAPDRPSVLPQILNPDHYVPALRDTIAYAAAGGIARRLLGDTAVHMGMHAIRKPPRAGGETPLHQDEAYWDPRYAHDAVSVWMPLQPATLDNGCMQFVPGSHLHGVREHRLVSPDASGLVAVDSAERSGLVACPLPPGGATVHSNRTLHFAGPNTTDEPRRALIMAFATPGRLLDEPRDFFWQPPEWSG